MEAAWKHILAFLSGLEESSALLGGGLKPRVDWRTILRRLGGGLGRLGSAFVGLGRDIGFIVEFLSIFSSRNE